MVISTVNQVVYNGDGITTAWPYTFRIIDATDIKLAILETDGTETEISSDYYVDTVNNTVYYPGYAPGAEPPEEDQPPVLPAGKRLLIYRQLPITQEKDLGEKWPFEVIELALDKLTMILQQVYEWWGRCLKISPAARAEHPDFDMTFPIEAGKSFRVNAEGTGFEVSADPQPYAEMALEAATTAAAAAETAAEAAALVDVQAFWFDSIAEMKAANLPVGATTGTKGYYSANDGGNGTYAVREADGDVDDGGSIIVLDNGNVAELITNGTVTLRQFGAKGDGITDDTSAFNNALSFANCILVTKGTYLISFSAPLLWKKKIVGENAEECIIKQSNKNVAFCQVSVDSEIANITFVTEQNDTATAVLHYGRLVYFENFFRSYVHHVNFKGNEYSIPFYFNFLDGGCVGGTIENIYIKGCYKGFWFHFHDSNVTYVQWLTSQIVKDVFIEDPAAVGFEWDDLPYSSVYKDNNISYNNYFGNIAVELFKSGSIGFIVGNHMGVLENPMCYNDIQATDDEPDPYGYSIRVCPVGTPAQYKHYTKIIGGSLEGLIDSAEYMYLLNCQNVSTSSRRRFDSAQYYEVYDGRFKDDIKAINVFDSLFVSNNFTLNNCNFQYGQDHRGVYIQFYAKAGLQPSDTWGFDYKIANSDIISWASPHKKATFMAYAYYQGNHRVYATGLPTDSTTDPNASYYQFPYNGCMIDLVHYDFTNDPGTGDFHIGFTTSKADNTSIRIYSLHLLRDVVGAYWIIDDLNRRDLNLRQISYGYRKQSFTNSGSKTDVFYSSPYGSMPSIKVAGQLPAMTAGSNIELGTLEQYEAYAACNFNVVDNSTVTTVGRMGVTYNGVVRYYCTSTHGALTSISGSF